MRPLGWCVRGSVGIISGTIGQLYSAAIELYLDLPELSVRIVSSRSVGKGVIRGTVVDSFGDRMASIVTGQNLAAGLFCHFLYRAPFLKAGLRLGVQVVFVGLRVLSGGEARAFRGTHRPLDSPGLQPADIHGKDRNACRSQRSSHDSDRGLEVRRINHSRGVGRLRLILPVEVDPRGF